MKKNLLSALISLSVIALLSSCGNDHLTTSVAESALEKTNLFKDSSVSASLDLGYMQIDDADSRLKYRKLEKAGVISYKMEVIIEERVYRGWGSTSVKQIPHYFVTAALTPEGEKFRIYNHVKSVEEDDEVKDAENNEIYPEDIEFASDVYVAEGQQGDNGYANVEDYGGDGNYDDVSETGNLSPYQAAQGKCNFMSYNMYAGRLDLVKVRNIKENQIAQTASAQAIIQLENVSPFGRVLLGLKNGRRSVSDLNLERFVDKGWVVKE